MLNNFITYCDEKFFLLEGRKTLLAVSGGKDSMAMFHLFRLANFPFEVAHCNFNLRGKESDMESEFVKDICQLYKIPFHYKKFDTLAYKEKNKLSTQMAARELRYGFFNEIVDKYNLKQIATAHTKNDALENFFIHLYRNNYHKLFNGIAVNRNNIIRPILCFSSQQILQFLTENNFEFKEDSSNANTDYLRNKIRCLFVNEIENIENAILDEYIAISEIQQKINFKKKEELSAYSRFHKTQNGFIFLKTSLQKNLFVEFVFHLGFNKTEIIKFMQETRLGSKISTTEYELFNERNAYSIVEKKETLFSTITVATIDDIPNEIIFSEYKIVLNLVHTITNKNGFYFDANKIQFPLTIRSAKEKEKVCVFPGNIHKKISDIFTENKVENKDKGQIPIVCDANEVLCVGNLRRSNAAIIDNDSVEMIEIKLSL